ncbi:MAG: 1-acyl-sn-glycerol-3-phosphate acyltransferase, partial [Rectinema sp.]|nr:1-acyl-sn-glycerol-3-phosphate acyltransferase [Rectinema sp.]
MIHTHRYHPTNFMWFTWLLRHTYGLWLKSAYHIIGFNTELFKSLAPPFIVVGNHTTILDPFIANAFIPHPVHWVASDGNMRNPIMRFLLIKLVGSIPKSKAIPDLETVNWIVEIIRKKKGVVGLYPEGQSSWNGTATPAFPATAKLLKLLKAPVVMAKTMGGYLTKPRWSHVQRAGKVEISFSVLFTPEQLRSMSWEEIDRRLNEAIAFDDTAWCKANSLRFESDRGAESLELALYVCPACGGLATMHSRGSEFRCERCGFAVAYQADGSFCLLTGGTHKRVPTQGETEAVSYTH